MSAQSELAQDFRLMRDRKKAVRAKFGVQCPKCIELLPKCFPSILLPQQRCKVDGYRDLRPALTDADWRDA